jgi:hypothetical protein
VDGYASVVVIAKLQAFAEALMPSIEVTPITRDGDSQLDCWSTEIYSKRAAYSLRSGLGGVRLFVEQLDSKDREMTLLCEAPATEEGLETLRVCLAGWELISELSARRNHRGLQALWKLLEDAMVGVNGARRSALRSRWRAR